MAKLIWTPAAREDIKGILDYIGVEQERPAAARKLASRILKTCELFATQPHMGEPRPDLADDIRLFPVRPYVVFFFPLRDGIRIARVAFSHGTLQGSAFSAHGAVQCRTKISGTPIFADPRPMWTSTKHLIPNGPITFVGLSAD